MAPPRQRPSGFGTSPGDTWEIGMARMPFFVPGDDGQTIRPLVALVMDGSGPIRATAMGHPEHPSKALAKALQEAIHHPPSGLQPGNPQQVTVPSARLLEDLRPLYLVGCCPCFFNPFRVSALVPPPGMDASSWLVPQLSQQVLPLWRLRPLRPLPLRFCIAMILMRCQRWPLG
jgi:hypothetical protein